MKMTDVEQLPQNGIDFSAAEDDDSSKARPADIEQDMREMERRKRVEAIMSSKLFREELERIVDCARDSGNAAGILQQLSDIVGVPSSRVGSVLKTSTCMLPINDIRGVESMGYAKGEKILRCKLAATFRLLDLYGWTQGLGAQITARLKVDQEYFLVNPYGLLYHEITASSLNKVDMQANIVEQGTTNFGVNKSHFVLHSVVHAARPDIRCAIYIGCQPVVAISSLKAGLLPLTKDACVLGELSTHSYTGYLSDEEERNKLVRNLGPNSKVLLLTNHGALCCGETIEEAFFGVSHIVKACEIQLKLLPVNFDNLVLIPEECRKIIYDHSRRPPEDLEKKFEAATIVDSDRPEDDKKEPSDNAAKIIGQTPKWRVGGAEFEALMRMLDNAGYRTGYIYRHPLIKSEPPKPKNDVELPPAVSSLGYLLEEEELFRQGIWKKGDLRKGGDRSRWLNSPNVYQKVEVLETGTPDPKKITKWIAEGSPTHSTPVRIDDPLQFVPVNTNPKEFKRVQQQIKDNRRADKISAGPQSHILEGVTWDEANRIKDATVSSAGDHVVLMGAASKGIIQRGFQHNATVYKAPYAKNPFDNVTDDELNEYKRTVERKKKSIHGEYTDTDFSESEALSSLHTSGAQQQQTKQTTTTTAAVSQSEPEDISEHQVMRIQTEQAPIPSQPEVVLSDDIQLLKHYQEPTNFHQSFDSLCYSSSVNQHQSTVEYGKADKEEEEKEEQLYFTDPQENNYKLHDTNDSNEKIIKNLEQNLFYQKQKALFTSRPHTHTYINENQGNGNTSNFSIFNSSHKSLSKNINKFHNSLYIPFSNEHFCLKCKSARLLKKNYRYCYTPEICKKIFDSVQKLKSLQTQRVINSHQYLNRCENKTSTVSHSKSNGPYRTVSHFGFNRPILEPQPNHKHLLAKAKESRNFVSLRRSVSYEEIFASPRYLNLCECCFEFIVRLKNDVVKSKTKFNNSIEHDDATNNVLIQNYNDDDLSEIPLNGKAANRNYSQLTAINKCLNKKSQTLESSINWEVEDDILESHIHFNLKTSNDALDNFTNITNNNRNSLTEVCEITNLCDTVPNELSRRSRQNSEREMFETSSKKLINREDRLKRKLELHELWTEDHVNFANHGQNFTDMIAVCNTVERKNQNMQNTFADVDMENMNKRNSLDSLGNEDVEEFNSTLSRITFHSFIDETCAKGKDDEQKCFEILAANYNQLENSNHNLEHKKSESNLKEIVTGLSNDECTQDTHTFSLLERTILEKIHENDLNKSEEIFEKIENSIRNKINPSILELIIKEHTILLQDVNKNGKRENILSKSLNLSNTSSMNESLQKSSSCQLLSLTPKNSSCLIDTHKSTSDSIRISNASSSTISPHSKKSVLNKHRKPRNFILENIRNVSIPREMLQIKRPQSNVDAKVVKKQSFSSPRILQKERNESATYDRNPQNRPSPAVHSFRTKLVRGSPRFWISMSQSSTTKSLTSPPPNIGCVTSPTVDIPKNACSDIEKKSIDNVDAAISALGDEIQQIQPRLENYKRKLDAFGHRVADCINDINDCVSTQEKIISIRKKFKDCTKLREYTEGVMCRVHTFSLSETED